MIKVIFIGLIFSLTSCGNLKDTLTLKKKPSGDEFLVEKKNPLVLPPEFGKLPSPIETKEDEILNQQRIENHNEIKKLLTNKEEIINNSDPSKSTKIEETILKNIK